MGGKHRPRTGGSSNELEVPHVTSDEPGGGTWHPTCHIMFQDTETRSPRPTAPVYHSPPGPQPPLRRPQLTPPLHRYCLRAEGVIASCLWARAQE